MRKASITEAKNNLSALIDSLRGGSPVLIVDRGRPVPRLEAVMADSESEQGGRLSRLVRDGVVRPRRGVAHRALFSSQPPRASASASVVDALIKERREGR
jgi:antitoxin (DNA-binding transcriptional repressor) of toxin-antitoxin stability system